MIVVDASAVVSALIDSGPTGLWSETQLGVGRLAAPHLLYAEAANVIRRAELAGEISVDVAALAFRDLIDLPVDPFPFEPFAERVWQLRTTITAYDAWYVALAESLEAALVTLDVRLASAPGPRCRFAIPSD